MFILVILSEKNAIRSPEGRPRNPCPCPSRNPEVSKDRIGKAIILHRNKLPRGGIHALAGMILSLYSPFASHRGLAI